MTNSNNSDGGELEEALEGGLPVHDLGLPEEVERELIKKFGEVIEPEESGEILVAIAKSYQGPIPSPRTLAEFEEISPGLANRLVLMAEKEQQAGIDIPMKVLDRDIAFARYEFFGGLVGVIAGFLSMIIMVCTAAWFFTKGSSEIATVILGLTITSIVVAFVTGSVIKPDNSSNEETSE